MTRAEKWWCLAISAVLVALTTLPFLLAFQRQGSELRFTGSILAVEDGNSYIAKMRRGADGDWLFRSPYTAQDQTGIPAFLGYLLLGKLAGGEGFHEQLVALLHLARLLAIPAVVYATYRFVSRFLAETRWRKWATLTSVAGGGLGWSLLLLGKASWLGSQPLELYSPETFGFLAALTFPHLLLARACLLMGLDAYLEASLRARAAWAAAGWFVCLIALQPLALAAAVAAVGAHQILLHLRASARRDGEARVDVRPAFVSLAGPALVVGGYALLLLRDPFFRDWSAQNVLPSPHAAHYLLAFGLLLPPAVVGCWRIWTEGSRNGLLAMGWALALPILAYAPVAFQRRLPEGGWVALCALAAIGLAGRGGTGLRAWRLGLVMLALSLIGSGLLLAGAYRAALLGEPPVFRSADEVAGFEWLAENAEPGSVVLASYATGNALPAWAPEFVMIGHGPESVGLRELEPRIRRFLASSGSGAENQDLLQEYRVSYVFVGPAERAMGFEEAIAGSVLGEVYRQGGVAIYEVDTGRPIGRTGLRTLWVHACVVAAPRPCQCVASG